MAQSERRVSVIHQSLTRPILLAGAEYGRRLKTLWAT